MQWLRNRASRLFIIGFIASIAWFVDAEIARSDGRINDRLDRLLKADGT